VYPPPNNLSEWAEFNSVPPDTVQEIRAKERKTVDKMCNEDR